MEIETDNRSLVALRGGRIPEILGFHLDDHNVEEWSDGLQHRARQEKGTWINPERNADIQYQKREDSKKFVGGEEKEKTEVIEGKSPDSTFQIIRTHRQFQDKGTEEDGSHMSSSSTSYQMSTSRSSRSTIKTSSNKTTSKTVTVSGSRTDDFENLKMSFQPLDSTTQRERINMSRSGTMGSRRPPTKLVRRPATTEPVSEVIDITEISDTTIDHSPVGGISILGYKNLSPKIRVGFPVEIQLELQTKLGVGGTTNGTRMSEEENLRNRSNTRLPSSLDNGLPANTSGNADLLGDSEPNLEQNQADSTRESSDSALPLYPNNRSSNNGQSTFDFSQRRKSYGFESFDSHVKQTQMKSIQPPAPNSNPHPINGFQTRANGFSSMLSSGSFLAPRKPPTLADLPRSWDLVQNAANAKSNFHTRRTTENGLEFLAHESSTRRITPDSEIGNQEFNWDQKVDSDEEMQQDFTFDSLEDSSAKSKSEGKFSTSVTEIHSSIPNIHNDSSYSPSSPTSERSRKLMEMLNETPDLLNKISFKNYISSSPSAQEDPRPEESHVPMRSDNWNIVDAYSNASTGEQETADWERQKRQLNFLSDSLNRILDSSSVSSESSHQHFQELHRLKTRRTDEFDDENRKTPTQEGRVETSIDMDVDYNSNIKRPTQVSHTWISSGDSGKPIQQVRDQDVTTTISATYDSIRKPFKRVEFCKTEVHFTPDSGKFNIVETDENKPSTVHLFRRKKRNRTLDNLKGSDSESLGIVMASTETQSPASTNLDNSGKGTKEEPEETFEVGVSDDWGDEVKKKISDDITSNRISHGERHSSVNEILTSLRRSQAIGNDELSKQLHENNRLMMNLNLNVDLGVGDIERSDDQNHSPNHTILSKYGELKIQRYLKQLTSPSSISLSETSETSLDPELTQLHDNLPDEDSQFRFDNTILYEHGSFVPMATRKSLIEMNNRNRKRSSHATESHTSENSSTGSSYSLPNSETNSKSGQKPLKLTAMEATVRTAGAKPQITSVELRYSVEDKDTNEESDNYYSKQYNSSEPMIVPQLSRQNSREERGNIDFPRQVPFAVMPPEISHPPYRNGSYSLSPSSSPSRSPTRELPAFRHPKPPTPILPIQFSTFEKTGAAMRERFYSKNPSCGCHAGGTESDSGIPSQSLLGNHGGLTSTRYTNFNAVSSSIPAKSIVTIGDRDKFNFSHIDNPGKAHEFGDTNPGDARKFVTSNRMPELHQDDERKSGASTPEPNLGKDHTWKGPAHFESQSAKGTSLTRSMTFPKSTRPEPEWVLKAKSREARITDWNLVGKPYSSARKSEPPWISEIRFKNKTSSAEQIKSLPKISMIYPWQRESNMNGRKRMPAIAGEEEDGTVAKSLISVSFSKVNANNDIALQNEKSPSWKPRPSKVSTSSTGNKSIVDLNRDSDSILINTPQIKMKPTETDESHQRIVKSKQLCAEGFPARSTHKSKTISLSHDSIVHNSTNHIINGSKSLATLENSQEGTSNRKPLHSSAIANKSAASATGPKSKAPPKPPKPPQRSSSLVKTQTTGFSASMERKHPRSKVITHSHSNSEESPGSSRSNTPIHRHPTVKVSKLPLKSSPDAPTPDGKTTSTQHKAKPYVSLTAGTKRIHKNNDVADFRSSPSPTLNVKNSPSHIQHHSPRTGEIRPQNFAKTAEKIGVYAGIQLNKKSA